MKFETTKELRGLRGKYGFSLEYTGEQLNIHRETYRKYEKNPMIMPVEKLLELLDLLQADKDRFFCILLQDNMSYQQLKKSGRHE